MVTRFLPDSDGQTRAIVHVPRSEQRREIPPVQVEASRVEKPSRRLPFRGRSVGQYRQYADTYVSDIPAIVLDITR